MTVTKISRSVNPKISRHKTSVLGFVLASVLFSVGLVGVPRSVAAKPVISTTKDDDWKTGPLPDEVKKKDLDALVKTAMVRRITK